MSSQKDTRGTDPLDHLRLSCSEGNVVATKVAKAAIEFVQERLAAMARENQVLQQWVSDLQAKTFVNCVYCGHRYGPSETTPVSMADALKLHIEACPKHPMAACRRKAAAFDAIAYRKVFVRDCSRGDDVLLTAYPRCGFLPFSPDELLTAIEAALEGEEPANG